MRSRAEEWRVQIDQDLWASLVTNLCLPVFRRKSGLGTEEGGGRREERGWGVG